jgi:predicted RNase H-like HicB family nuclease
MNRVVLCYVERSGGQWQGLCLDFDIAVQGNSLEEVLDGLKAGIGMYIEAAKEMPEADRHRLLHRRAPLLVRLAISLRLFWAGLRGGGTGDRCDMMMPCPA